MAMNGVALGDRIAAIITHSKATPEMKAEIKRIWEKICVEIVNEVKKADITVPTSSVIIAVAGSATGTPNPAPIKNNIK